MTIPQGTKVNNLNLRVLFKPISSWILRIPDKKHVGASNGLKIGGSCNFPPVESIVSWKKKTRVALSFQCFFTHFLAHSEGEKKKKWWRQKTRCHQTIGGLKVTTRVAQIDLHGLQSTLAGLDEKTRTMLKLVEEDADFFAKRAEMYYKRRPELVNTVEDLYQAQRSLAEGYDQVKSESGTRLVTTPWSSPLSINKSLLEKSISLCDKAYDSYSETYGPEESDESEVDDPEEV
ncbi:protein NETWORKED 3C-like [Olea europaea var. sylvestris]|uniref:protein NETWORKED 3C-like n=1 Tax=Olea europaea var. sylvestris TaxID=158386 RepID=UPI000C1CF7E3|nr:protein NETWORKED 3C-like [Olea europaea var. sylvestris]